MNNLQKYTLLLSLLIFWSCSGEEELVLQEPQLRSTLQLIITASDFITDGAPSTRAADNGNTTTFEDGDRVGVIVLDKNNKLLSDNIPYKYSGGENGTWSFDGSSESESKSQCYYDNNAKTYIVYYPYSKDADGVTNETDLRSKFPPKADQRVEADYRASDLMVCTSTPATALKELSITLTHAYASVSLSPEVKYKLATGKDFSYVPPGIFDVNFTISDKLYYPYQAEDGSFRYILPASFSGDIRCFFTFDGKTYGNTITVPNTASANTRYSSTPTRDAGEYGLDKAQVGDYYYSDGNIYPNDAKNLPAEGCIGIVFYVGKGTGNFADNATYTSKGGTTMTDIHGYVVALNDANDGNTCVWSPFFETIGTNQSMTLFCGYTNTQIIKKYAIDNSKTLSTDFPATYYATDDYETDHASPANSSGWFLPSSGQLKCLYDNRNNLNKENQIFNAFIENNYWSSSEYDIYPDASAWRVPFNNGYINGGNKPRDGWIRSCLTF